MNMSEKLGRNIGGILRQKEKRNDHKLDMEWLLEDEIRAGLKKGDQRSKERRWRK